MKGGLPIATSALSRHAVRLAILRRLAASPHELGASTLRRELLANGIDVSEATIGRMLREFDIRGQTRRNGKLGHTLTAEGARSLETLEVELERETGSREITAVLSVPDEAKFVMVLEARRAIERETSRLAATRATPRQIKEMERAADAHLRGVLGGALVTEYDASLHRLIARAAGNVFLEKLLDFIREDREVAAVVRSARERSHLQCAREHEAIVRAIGVHDSGAAERAMMAHLDGLIEAVRSSFSHKTDTQRVARLSHG